MREIIGESLKPCMDYFEVDAKMTYSGKIGYWPNFEVWEMSEEEYNKLCAVTDEQWDAANLDGSWWRGANGSVLGTPNVCFLVNGENIWAWEDEDVRDTWIEEFKEYNEYEYGSGRFGEDDFLYYCQDNGRYEYDNLLTYMCEEIGASTEKNVCALAVDLAKRNEITMAELFRKYGGSV